MTPTTLDQTVASLGTLSSVVSHLPADVHAWVQTIGDHQAVVHVHRDVDSPIDPDAEFDRIVAALHELHVGGTEATEGDAAFTPGLRVWTAGVAVAGWNLSVVVRSDA